MSLTDWIILITELVGTIAFAVSGSLTAIERRLDFSAFWCWPFLPLWAAD